jgi:hypothetical protein
MKKHLIALAAIMTILSCSVPEKPTQKEIDLSGIYAGLRKDSVYTKFVGFHIVRRSGSDCFFMYRNLRIDSSCFVVPNLNAIEGTRDYKEKELFFKDNPDAHLQLDVMKKYGIRAVLTDNYNEGTKRLESSDSIGYGFAKYELTFALSDSIDLACINFNCSDYMQVVAGKYRHIERLDSNWFVLKRP